MHSAASLDTVILGSDTEMLGSGTEYFGSDTEYLGSDTEYLGIDTEILGMIYCAATFVPSIGGHVLDKLRNICPNHALM